MKTLYFNPHKQKFQWLTPGEAGKSMYVLHEICDLYERRDGLNTAPLAMADRLNKLITDGELIVKPGTI